jgi:c-di-AMP phosphodiesterase-like protein
MAVKDLYDLDFFEWTQQNAELLRKRCLSEIDVDNLAEEVADMGKRDRREMDSYLTRLILHLLKWQMQPALRYGQSGRSSWLNSIVHSRAMLEKIFEQSPSLKRLAEESLPRNYPLAVREASVQTQIDRKIFPQECPYSLAELLDQDYLPE